MCIDRNPLAINLLGLVLFGRLLWKRRLKLIFEEGIAFATSGVKYSYRTNFVSNFTSFVLLVLLLGLA